MTAPPRSPPYLKIWIRYCGLLAHALPMLVYRIWRVNCDKQDWKDEEMGQKLKKQRRVEVSQLFLPETVALVTIQNSDNERWNYCVVGCSILLNKNEWHNSTETANHDINWPMSTQLKNTISFSGRKTSYKYYYGRQENNDNIIFIQEWTVFLNLRMNNRV